VLLFVAVFLIWFMWQVKKYGAVNAAVRLLFSMLPAAAPFFWGKKGIN
jgi:hypothetical protein